MSLNERQSEIFDMVCQREKISVAELSKTLYVSEMTIRRDLAEMEKKGFVKRYRGGVIALSHSESVPLSNGW